MKNPLFLDPVSLDSVALGMLYSILSAAVALFLFFTVKRAFLFFDRPDRRSTPEDREAYARHDRLAVQWELARIRQERPLAGPRGPLP